MWYYKLPIPKIWKYNFNENTRLVRESLINNPPSHVIGLGKISHIMFKPNSIMLGVNVKSDNSISLDYEYCWYNNKLYINNIYTIALSEK